jgi:predicted RNA binding protein YcfA (HicA-like mRNA interferase family)
MTKLPQISHERIVRALKYAGFYVLREGKHIATTDQQAPPHYSSPSYDQAGTLRHILDAAEISPDRFKELI